MKYASVYEKCAGWFREGLWRAQPDEMPRYQAWPLRWLRIVTMSLLDFSKDHAAIRASALTFYTVLAIVPLAALAFGIAKGFGVESMLEETLRARLAGQEEAANRIIEFAQNQLQQTRGGLVAGAGVILLLWTATRVLANIEVSFNAIWNTERSRSFFRKIGDYIAFLTLAPILLIAASSLTVYLAATMQEFAEAFALWGVSGMAAALVARLLPAVLLWVLFTSMYLFMPNTRVPVVSAAVGGIAAGTLFQVVQAVYIHFQIGASAYGAIYGSFAALPLFLIWLNLSWVIVLYGAELAYAHEHAGDETRFPYAKPAGPALLEYAALGVMHRCVRAVLDGSPPPGRDALGAGLPRAAVSTAINRLLAARLLVQATFGGDRAPAGYLPATDANTLTIADVLTRLRLSGAEEIVPTRDAALERLRDCAAVLDRTLLDAPENLRLKDLA
jgi:membrane protein